jgi:hypothetical protein
MKKLETFAICVTTVIVLGSLAGCSSDKKTISLANAIEETRKDINNLYYKELSCPHYGLLLSDVTVVFKVKADEGGQLVVAPNVKPFINFGGVSYSTNTARSNTITIHFTNFLPGLLASSSKAMNKSGESVLEKLLIDPNPPPGQSVISQEQEKLRQRIVEVLSWDLNMGNEKGDKKENQEVGNAKNTMKTNNCVSSDVDK